MPSIAYEKNINRRKFTFLRGVHPPQCKDQSWQLSVETVELKPGQEVVVPMSQHLGAPCQPVVQAKQEVTVGQLLGDSDAFISAPVHSPTNGIVKSVSPQPHPSGKKCLSVVITVGQNPAPRQQWQSLQDDTNGENLVPQEIVSLIRQAGIVGMGGAAFPTAVKLTANPKKPVDTVILNGCECEPYLTSDNRLMMESPGPILAGLELAMRAAGANKGIIAIEDNKPQAINSIFMEVKNRPNLQLAICRTKYPQGGERQLVKAVLDRAVPTGGLPLDVAVVVVNVGTAAAIAFACREKRPLTERIVSVSGDGVVKPGNYRVPIGMLLSDLIDYCGGLTDDAEKVLLGGPMMGNAAAILNLPILKGTSGVTVLSRREVRLMQETPCIRCSRCVDNCPLRLVPTRIAHAIKARDLDRAREYDLFACIECGCCAFVCPAKIPLVQYIKSGKRLANQAKKG